jgi:hypothetical protein
VSKHLVLDDGGVVGDEDVLDGYSGHVGKEHAPDGVCDRGIDPDERERGLVGIVAVELDLEVVRKPGQ